MRNLSNSYAKGGSLEAHGIQVGDTFIKTVSGAIQKVKDKNGNIVFIDLSNGYRDTQPPLPFEDGGYTDLDKSKPEVINDGSGSKENTEILEAIETLELLLENSPKKDRKVIKDEKDYDYDVEIPEIDIEKIRTIDLDIKDNKILSLDDSIRVLKQIYDKGSINAYEEVKILYLDNSNKVIGVYNHSKGGVTGTVIDVEMVCALAVKCLARGVIMSHNHPSGSLKFSDADIKVTRELKNALNLFKIALLDSIVITDNGFTSMTNEGILANGGSLSRFDNDGSLIGNQKNIDLNRNGKIDSEDFKLLRSSMNGAWRNEHEHVNQSNSKQHYEVRYAKPRPSRTGYKGKRNFAEGGGVGIEEEIDLTDDNRLRVKELTYEYKKPTAKELAEKHNSGAYEFMEQDKMMSGGKTTFQDKSDAIAKRFVGKKVEPKYQKEYGKVYSKDEAKEVGNKITGSMVSKEKMMLGGKTKKGNGEAMLLAKKIRKDGEKWTDAVKRAWLQLK